jgi:hypothetical protein
MKVWVLAGLFTFATAPFAMAAEDPAECQLDEARRTAQQRVDTPPADPAATIARPTVAQRDTTVEPAPRASTAGGTDRRRNGKRIPDAQLIGPRGAL